MRDVYTSPGGIFSSVQAGSLLIDCSTIDGESAIAMNKLAREKNTQYVDAPVSGGTLIILSIQHHHCTVQLLKCTLYSKWHI